MHKQSKFLFCQFILNCLYTENIISESTQKTIIYIFISYQFNYAKTNFSIQVYYIVFLVHNNKLFFQQRQRGGRKTDTQGARLRNFFKQEQEEEVANTQGSNLCKQLSEKMLFSFGLFIDYYHLLLLTILFGFLSFWP